MCICTHTHIYSFIIAYWIKKKVRGLFSSLISSCCLFYANLWCCECIDYILISGMHSSSLYFGAIGSGNAFVSSSLVYVPIIHFFLAFVIILNVTYVLLNNVFSSIWLLRTVIHLGLKCQFCIMTVFDGAKILKLLNIQLHLF